MTPMKLTREQIMELQPHRDPILLVDEVLELVPGDYVIGRFYVDPEMPVLKGHFPGDPMLPGIYIMESAGQTSNMVRATMPQYKGKTSIALGINYTRFYKKVRPGDTMEIHSKLVAHREDKGILTMRSKVYVDGELVCEHEAASAMR